jgi:hypothetical protein
MFGVLLIPIKMSPDCRPPPFIFSVREHFLYETSANEHVLKVRLCDGHDHTMSWELIKKTVQVSRPFMLGDDQRDIDVTVLLERMPPDA